MKHRRRGMILVLVLVVIALLALAAGTFSHLMLAERKAVDVSGRRAQARALADSGVEMARQFIVQTKEVQDQFGGWYDNELQFRGRMLIADQQGVDPGRFTIVAPREEYGIAEGIRYGLEDESTRLNLNALMVFEKRAPGTGRQILMGLPGMTEEIADAILDWMDEDEEPREFGAESEYYASLNPPYAPKNGPLESLEELLLVRGIRENPRLLFGCDLDRNALIDVGEADNQGIVGVDNSDGSMNRGWAAYLTLYGLESNLNPDGEPKIDLNQSDMQQLHDQLQEALGEEWARFIVAYRLGEDAGEDEPASAGATIELDYSQQPKRTLSTVLDLIGKNVKLTSGDNAGNAAGTGGAPAGGAPTGGAQGGAAQETILETPFPDDPASMDSYLPTLMDYVAVVTTSPLAGRININQAPRVILKGIPGMTEEIVDRIIAAREPNPTIALPTRHHETWILSEGLVTLEQMKALMPFVTAGGSVYRVQVVGYFDRGGPAVRIEAVLDATSNPARVLFWRDITNLGRGYPLEILGVGAGSQAAY
jgi:hypothetical protein